MPTPGVAGEPMEAPTVVTTTRTSAPRLRSTPKACARKTVAAPWYSAVPSMLTVVPKGTRNCAMDVFTASFSSAVFMVRGITAAELDVEKARSWTSRTLPRKFQGALPDMV